MYENAVKWATARGKIRTNPVHGEQELQIPLEETYSREDNEMEETTRQGTIEVQAGFDMS